MGHFVPDTGTWHDGARDGCKACLVDMAARDVDDLNERLSELPDPKSLLVTLLYTDSDRANLERDRQALTEARDRALAMVRGNQSPPPRVVDWQKRAAREERVLDRLTAAGRLDLVLELAKAPEERMPMAKWVAELRKSGLLPPTEEAT